MKKIAKKVCSVILALCVIFSAVSMLPVSAATIKNLILDLPTKVTVAANGSCDLYFTPQESGSYIFSSAYDEYMDPYAYLYDSNNNYLVTDDDSGDGRNFLIEHELIAGETYRLNVTIYGSSSGSFAVTVTRNPVASITVDPVSIIEGTSGGLSSCWNSETQKYDNYYHYYWYNNATAIITFTDGTVVTGQIGSDVQYNGKNYYINHSENQGIYNQWTAGNTYTCTANFMGKTVEVPVTITPSPVTSVTVDPITVIEGTDGYWTHYWNSETQKYVEFFYYNWCKNATATITFNDGTVISKQVGTYVQYNGKDYYIGYTDNQGNTSQWTVGNTYTMTVDFMGKIATAPVTVTPSPIASIAVEPVTVAEGVDGYWNNYWDSESQEYIDYFYYRWYNNATATITFTDGTVITGRLGSNVQYNGKDYYIGYSDNQGVICQWTAGNTYNPTVTFMGETVEVPVTITPSPIASVTVGPITVTEGVDGYWTSSWNSESQEYIYYFRYYWCDKAYATVNFNDGTVVSGMVGSYVQYNGESYYIGYSDNQSVSSQWTAGNSYNATVTCMGKTAEATIKITEAPYKSIEIVSSEPIKDTDISYIDWNGNTIYNIPDFTYKITFKDGKVLESTYQSDNNYNLSVTHTQQETPWTPNGQNLVTVRLGTLTTTFSVEMIDVPDWEYVEQNGGLFITNCGITESEITVPEQIDGVPVIGIMSMGDCLSHVNTITLPDSVTYISNEAFADGDRLYTINVGKNVSNLDSDAFQYNYSLSEINVSAENPHYTTVDGVVYDKTVKTLVVYPLGQSNWYSVPDSVTNADVLFVKDYYANIYVSFSEDSKAFKLVDGVTYNSNMTVVISCDPEKTGSYDMPDTVTNVKANAFYGSQLSEVTVSDNVSEIVYCAFSYCNNLETITLPNTLTAINDWAFCNSNLKNLKTLPNALTEIGEFAFANTLMTSINIPSGVAEIGGNAFANSCLESLTLNSGLISIGDQAFSENNISSLSIPNTVTSIGSWSFNSNNIKTLTIPDNVTTMGSGAFYNNPISSLKLGSGLTEISSNAFEGSALTDVTIPKNISYIQDSAFADSPLSRVIFEADEVYIGNGSFRGCPLDQTTLTDNIKKFGSFAFASNSMTSVVIPDSVTDITYYSFAYSVDLASIDIPDKITNIDGTAFKGTAWYNAQDEGVIYLENTLYGYKGDIPENTEIFVKNGTLVIADYAFEHRWGNHELRDVSGLKSVVLPEGVVTIGNWAFYQCSNLEKIVIPSSVTNIADDAFYGCSNLTIYGADGSYAQAFAQNNGIPFVVLLEKQNDDIKISTTTDVIDENAELVVEDTPLEEVIDKLPDEIKDNNIKAFDIYFELEGQQIQPNGTVTVEINVPSDFNGAYCSVYHIADDGTYTNMNAVFKDGKLIFTTTHFSIYAIVENTPSTLYGDTNGDGQVNGRDYGVLLQYLNGYNITINVDAADVTGDGSVNGRDYGLLLQYLNGWDVKIGPKS